MTSIFRRIASPLAVAALVAACGVSGTRAARADNPHDLFSTNADGRPFYDNNGTRQDVGDQSNGVTGCHNETNGSMTTTTGTTTSGTSTTGTSATTTSGTSTTGTSATTTSGTTTGTPTPPETPEPGWITLLIAGAVPTLLKLRRR